jgi:hypothetical protein
LHGTQIGSLYTYVDLNNDGIPEVIVSFNGRFFCGTGGCMVVIFKLVGKEYKELSSMGLVHAPVIVTEAKTNKYRNLIMYGRNYGVRKGTDGDYYCFKFNKKSYPYNPMDTVRLSYK